MLAFGALAAGQNVAPSSDVEEQAEDQSEDAPEASAPQPDPDPVPAPRSTPDPDSSSLDDLIPQDAVDNAEGWATRGAPAISASDSDTRAPGTQDSEIDLSDPVADTAGLDDPDFLQGPAFRFDLDTALDNFAIPEPEQLEPDPDRPSFADIAAPNLVDLPELEEFEVSDELILAFPVETDRFPEQTVFVERFRALSSIEQLDSGVETVPQLAARARADEELLGEMLRTYGYYSGEVIRQLSGGRRGFADQEREEAQRPVDQDPKVRFDILPGTRYRFGTIDLGALETLPDPDGSMLRETFGIFPGDPVNSDRIIEEEVDLRVALGENGYPFSELGSPDLLIDHRREEGDLTLPVEPGGKFAFGEVVSNDPDFLSGSHLEEIARFQQGDIYKTSLQSDLRRAILATGLVSSVAITPREVAPPQDGQPGEVAIDVAMERAPLRTISGAIGYGTEDGFKIEAGWEHRNLFPPEGALRLRGIFGTREQLASVTFRRNNFLDRDQILTLDAYASDIDTEAVDARSIALRGSFEKVSNLLFQKPLSWGVGAEVLYTEERNRFLRVEPAIIPARRPFTIVGLFGRATIDSSDDLLDPTEGFRLTGFLAPEYSSNRDVDSYYLRAQVDASVYRPVGNIVLAGRLRAATIQGARALKIAPSRRLYSGGGGSVRGYGFQAIGPTDNLGNPIGGASLVEGAVEARIQTGFLDGTVEVVPFIDAGAVSVSSSPDFGLIKVGAGLGVRYKTSFGPIRVDVGVPLNPGEFDAPVVVYVSLGQAF